MEDKTRMKIIKAIQIGDKEFENLLKDITHDGELLGNEIDTWEEFIGFVIDIKEIIEEKFVIEEIKKRFRLANILSFEINRADGNVLIIFEEENFQLKLVYGDNKMTCAEINDFARRDHRTKDQKYNRGLKLILEFGYEYMSADDDV